jgi:adenine-specific DNA glycosylase
VRREGRLLLVRRGQDERLLAGTWELPWAASQDEPAVALARRYGGRWRLGRKIGTLRHAITDRDIRLEVREATLGEAADVTEGAEAAWFEPDAAAALPSSSLLRKALALLES